MVGSSMKPRSVSRAQPSKRCCARPGYGLWPKTSKDRLGADEMVRFSDQAWESTASLREAIHGLPFNTELTAGSLSRDRFQTYIVQDAIYLSRFSRALAVAAAKAPAPSTM